VNGLDPEGILWARTLMRGLAAEGRTVFMSSHLMSEMAQTADHLIVIGRGRLVADMATQEFIGRSSQRYVRVAADDLPRLASLIEQAEEPATVTAHGDHLRVTGVPMPRIGAIAAAGGVVLHELTLVEPSLEAAFMELTQGSTEFQAGDAARAGAGERAGEMVMDR